jgi:hypothetical protein
VLHKVHVSKDRIVQTREAYASICALMDSPVLSHSTMSLVMELKARLEQELAQLTSAARASAGKSR